MPISERMAAYDNSGMRVSSVLPSVQMEHMPVAAPAPARGTGAGPGTLRDYSANSRYLISAEALGATHGDEPFAMGPGQSGFRTVDYSALNEKRHNWSRFDTFQTPTGHIDANNKIDGILREQDIFVIRSVLQKELMVVRSENLQCMEDLKNNFTQAFQDIRVELAYARKSAREDVNGAVEALKEINARDSHTVMESANDRRNEDLSNFENVVRSGFEEIRPMLRTCVETGPLYHKAMQDSMEKLKTDIDFGPILEAIKRAKETVTLSPVCQENVVKCVRDEIQKIRTKVDFTPVLTSIRDIKPEVDLTAVIRAIRESKTEVDLGPVFKAIRDLQTSVDFTPVFNSVRELKVGLDLRQVSTGDFIAAVREEIHKIRNRVDFTPVLEAIQHSKPEVDSMTLLNEVRASKPEIDFGPVLKAIQERRGEGTEEMLGVMRAWTPHIDLRQAFAALPENAINIDMGPILHSVKEVKTIIEEGVKFDLKHRNAADIDFAPLLRAMKEGQTQNGLTNPALANIHESIIGVYYKILAAINESKSDQDVPALLEATRMRLSREHQEMMAKMDAKHTEVMGEVRRVGQERFLPALPPTRKSSSQPNQ